MLLYKKTRYWYQCPINRLQGVDDNKKFSSICIRWHTMRPYWKACLLGVTCLLFNCVCVLNLDHLMMRHRGEAMVRNNVAVTVTLTQRLLDIWLFMSLGVYMSIMSTCDSTRGYPGCLDFMMTPSLLHTCRSIIIAVCALEDGQSGCPNQTWFQCHHWEYLCIMKLEWFLGGQMWSMTPSIYR